MISVLMWPDVLHSSFRNSVS